MSRFRELLAAGELVRVFALGRLTHPVTIDMFALAGGFHGFWLDQEHCGLTYQQVQLAAACARANNFDCFVRDGAHGLRPGDPKPRGGRRWRDGRSDQVRGACRAICQLGQVCSAQELRG